MQNFRVELHAWTDGPPPVIPGGVVDVTRHVVSLQWTDSLGPPWCGIQIALALPYRHWRDILPGRKVKSGRWTPGPTEAPSSEYTATEEAYGYVPEPGFWVVVSHLHRDQTYKALAFGRVTGIDTSYSTRQDSGLRDTNVVLTAESLLAFLGRSRVQLAAKGGVWGAEGFVYELNTWGANLSAILQSWNGPYVGSLLEKLFPSMVKIELPPSLGGGKIGEQVTVAYTNALANALCPMRRQQLPFVFGRTNLLNIAGSVFPNQTLLSFFASMFMGDASIIELFLSLEYPTTLAKPKTTGLGEKLGGAQPVLIYRLKPWILEPVTAFNAKKFAYKEDPDRDVGKSAVNSPKASGCEKMGIAQERSHTDPGQADIQWFDWNAEDVHSVRFAYDDGERANAAWFKTRPSAESPAQSYGLLGNPIVPNLTHIHRHGFRPAEVRWPFFENVHSDPAASLKLDSAADAFNPLLPGLGRKEEPKPSMIDYGNAVCELSWVYNGDGQRFCSGSFTGRFLPWAKPGHWARVQFADSTLTCYLEALTHNVSVDAQSGLNEMGTSARFSRGTLRYHDRSQPPEYQFVVATADRNIEGLPAQLLADGVAFLVNAATKALQALATAAAKPVVDNKVTVLTSDTPLLRVTGGVVRQDAIEFLLIHYTNGTTIAAMLREFNKARRTDKGLLYNTTTHYSVDKDGAVIEWIQPQKYYANSTSSKGDVFNRRSIGIDFLKLPGQPLTQKQLQAGQALVSQLAEKYKIPKKVSADRAPFEKGKDGKVTQVTKAPPYSYETVKNNQWGVLRHRDVQATRCPDTVPLDQLVLPPPAGTSIKFIPLPPGEAAKIKEAMKTAGYDPDGPALEGLA